SSGVLRLQLASRVVLESARTLRPRFSDGYSVLQPDRFHLWLAVCAARFLPETGQPFRAPALLSFLLWRVWLRPDPAREPENQQRRRANEFHASGIFRGVVSVGDRALGRSGMGVRPRAQHERQRADSALAAPERLLQHRPAGVLRPRESFPGADNERG